MMENNEEEQVEIFTDDMSEEQVIDAFMESKVDQPEEVTEVEEEVEITEPLEEPVEELDTNVEAIDDTVDEVAEEESSLDVIDFTSPVLLKDRDIELPINNSKELLDLARQGLNYTRKTTDFAKSKPMIDYALKHNISMDDLQALAEAKSGSIDAVGKIAKNGQVDPFDVDVTKEYTPNQDYTPVIPTEVDTFAAEIQQDAELTGKFKNMMDYSPESFKQTLSTDVDTLKKFTHDVKSGVAERLMPEALKLHALNGGDFVQSYIQAGDNVFKQTEQTQEQVAPTPTVKPVSENRAKAGISSSSNTSSNSMEFDTWGSSDADFLEKINQLTNR